MLIFIPRAVISSLKGKPLSVNIFVACLIIISGEVVFNSTGSIQLPSGTTAQRPGSPTNGDLRYNSTEHEVEAYKNGGWANVGSGQGATGGDDGDNAVFWENQQTVTHAYSLTASRNAGSFGPVTINSGITVTIPSTSSWTIV